MKFNRNWKTVLGALLIFGPITEFFSMIKDPHVTLAEAIIFVSVGVTCGVLLMRSGNKKKGL